MQTKKLRLLSTYLIKLQTNNHQKPFKCQAKKNYYSMKNFYIGKVIMFQTDICLVLDQMIFKKRKRGPENRGWMGGRSKIWKMPHVLPEECDFPPPQEKNVQLPL